MIEHDKIVKAAANQGIAGIAGALVGAITKSSIQPGPGTRCSTVVNVASAMSAAAATGSSLSGSLGTTMLASKVALCVSGAAVAAPFAVGAAVVGLVGFGLVKLFK